MCNQKYTMGCLFGVVLRNLAWTACSEYKICLQESNEITLTLNIYWFYHDTVAFKYYLCLWLYIYACFVLFCFSFFVFTCFHFVTGHHGKQITEGFTLYKYVRNNTNNLPIFYCACDYSYMLGLTLIFVNKEVASLYAFAKSNDKM